MQQAGLRITPPQGHPQCGQRQFLGHRIAHGPADDLAREQIEHQGQVQPALVGRDVGQISQPLLIRRRGLEIAFQYVRRHRVRVLRVRGHHPEPASLAAGQIMLAHETPDALVIDRPLERRAHLGGHPSPTIATPMLELGAANLRDDPGFLPHPCRRLAPPRIAQAAARHRQQLAHQGGRIRVDMRFNPGVPHIDSLAKYAAAFFSISFSSRSLAFSCRNRATSASSCVDAMPASGLAKGWPLRARNTQFASVFGDISNDRATDGILRPPSRTCFTAACRNSGVYFRSDPVFISYLHKVKLPCLVASVFRGPDQSFSAAFGYFPAP